MEVFEHETIIQDEKKTGDLREDKREWYLERRVAIDDQGEDGEKQVNV